MRGMWLATLLAVALPGTPQRPTDDHRDLILGEWQSVEVFWKDGKSGDRKAGLPLAALFIGDTVAIASHSPEKGVAFQYYGRYSVSNWNPRERTLDLDIVLDRRIANEEKTFLCKAQLVGATGLTIVMSDKRPSSLDRDAERQLYLSLSKKVYVRK